MKNFVVLLLTCYGLVGTVTPAIGAEASPASRFPSSTDRAPTWEGPLFVLSQDYPTTLPQEEQRPWETVDFHTHPLEYLEVMLHYLYEGNIESDWITQNNPVRNWYHVPWLHIGTGSRECIRGMTLDGPNDLAVLNSMPAPKFQGWSYAIYNAIGGYALGQIWKDPNHPDLSVINYPNGFPPGTVAAKLVFTEMDEKANPIFRDAPEWTANIYVTGGYTTKTPKTLRLAQIDIMVRDTRADHTTGWVFCTYAYNGDNPAKNPWARMEPTGISWGNDPGITPQDVKKGAVLKENWLNPAARPIPHYGWGKRLNGVLNNPGSSCASCHSTAQIPSISPMTAPKGSTVAEKMHWFRNIPAGAPFDPGAQSCDYSWQLTKGILNFLEAHSKEQK